MATPIKDAKQIIYALTNREVMAYIALFASIFGSIAMTIFASWIIWIVWQGGWAIDTAPQRISILAKALVISLCGSLIVLITLGFVISRRTIKVTKDGFIMESDGEPDDDDDDDSADGDGSNSEDATPTATKTITAKTSTVTEA